MPEYIDIHSHISFPDFDGDREAVMGRMKKKALGQLMSALIWKNSKGFGKCAVNEGIFLLPDFIRGQ